MSSIGLFILGALPYVVVNRYVVSLLIDHKTRLITIIALLISLLFVGLLTIKLTFLCYTKTSKTLEKRFKFMGLFPFIIVAISLLEYSRQGHSNIGGCFFMAALVCMLMFIYGYITKTNLMSIRSLIIMALISIVLYNVIGIFLLHYPIGLIAALNTASVVTPINFWFYRRKCYMWEQSK